MEPQPPKLPPRRSIGSSDAADSSKRSTMNSTASDAAASDASLKATPQRIVTQTTNDGASDKDTIDSGYGGSNSGTPGEKKSSRSNSYQPEETLLGNGGLFGRKPKKMHRFNLPISPAHQTRYCDLEETFCIALARLLATKKKKHVRPLDIGLVVLGHTETDARPCILVTCNKSIVRHVTSFFDSTWVKEELNPTSSDGFPNFDLYVKSIPCKPKAASLVEVFERKGDKDQLRFITNGYPIFAQTQSGWKKSTLGGFIEIVNEMNDVEMLGLTAGHLISPWDQADDQDDADDASETSDDSDDYDNPMDIDLDDIESADGTETEPATTSNPGTSEIPQSSDLLTVGHGYEINTILMGSKALDYALVKVGDRSRCFNGLKLHLPEQEPTKPTPSEAVLAKDVELLNTMGQGLPGQLSPHMSSLMLSPSTGFVKTCKLKLTGGQKITEGDSGAWVVDAETHAVYGHVVAVDLYGEAHVVSLPRIIQDIGSALAASQVRLATATSATEAIRQPSVRFQDAPQNSEKPPYVPDSGYQTRETSKNSDVEHSDSGYYSVAGSRPLASASIDSGFASAPSSYPPPWYAPPGGYVVPNAYTNLPLTSYNPAGYNPAGYNPVGYNVVGHTPVGYNPANYTMYSELASSHGDETRGSPQPRYAAPPVPTPASARSGLDSGYASKHVSPYNTEQKDAGTIESLAEKPGYDAPDSESEGTPIEQQLVDVHSVVETLRRELAQLKGQHRVQSKEFAALKAKAGASDLAATGDRFAQTARQTPGYKQPIDLDGAEKELAPLTNTSWHGTTLTALDKMGTAEEQAKMHLLSVQMERSRAISERYQQHGKIIFTDPQETQYVIPLSRVKKSEEIQSFIRDTVEPRIHSSNAEMLQSIRDKKYDLKDRWGSTIPLQFWEDVVEAGTITMHLWP